MTSPLLAIQGVFVAGAVAGALGEVAVVVPAPRCVAKYQIATATMMSSRINNHTHPRPPRCGSTRISAIRRLSSERSGAVLLARAEPKWCLVTGGW